MIILDEFALQIIATGALVGIAAALPGIFLVLRGSAMLTDAISHSILLGIFIVWWITREVSGPVQIVGAALAGLASVVMIEMVARTRRVKMDAAIGLVFPAFFALGVLLISLFARDVHIDEHTVLLGEIGFIWLDTVMVAGWELPRAMVNIGALALINALFVALFWKELKLAVFDAALASALGLAPAAIFYALLTLTSVTAVAAFDAVGVILFIAFVIVPPATALLLTDRLGRALMLACAIAVLSAVTGYALAEIWDVTIGGMMAVMTGVFFAAALALSPRHGLLARVLMQRGQKMENDCRALVVHLYNHEGTARAAEENTAEALLEHLHWSPDQAQEVVLRSLDRALIIREGTRLRLTPKGRAVAQELMPGMQAITSLPRSG